MGFDVPEVQRFIRPVGFVIALVGKSSATVGACALWHDGSSVLRRCVVML
jgi:hypothetical protein